MDAATALRPVRRPSFGAEGIALVAAAACAAAAAGVLYLYNPLEYGFYPRCLLYVLTGIYCPGCGTLRAMHALLHLRIAAALHYNALFVATLPFAVYVAASWARRVLFGAALPGWRISGRQTRVIFWLVVAFTVLRNIPLYPFNLLAP